MKLSERLANVGQEWDFEVKVEIIKEYRRAENDARRFRIAAGVLGMIGAGVVFLGSYGIYTNGFDAINGFWTAAGPICGTIIGYYFGKDGDEP